MTDTTAHHHHRQRSSWTGPRGRLVALTLILVAAIGGYVLGLNIAYRDLAASRQLVSQLQTESQKLKKQVGDQASQVTTLQQQLAAVQSAMHAMKPAKDTYEIKPNQSLVIADGHLTLGLIGSPANDSVSLNINGKVHNVATGDVITVSPDPAMNCHVDIQSFDMFKVTLVAACGAAKP